MTPWVRFEAELIAHEPAAQNQFIATFHVAGSAPEARAGQFVQLALPDVFWPRPFSLLGWRSEPGGLILSVRPSLIPQSTILAGVRGAYNAVWVQGRYGADTFYYGPQGYVPQGVHEQSFSDYSSYGFNAGATNPIYSTRTGLAGRKIGSIKDPTKTILVMEIPALSPYSWHDPKRPFVGNAVFNDAKNMVSFVDGHVSYIKIYWNTNRIVSGGISYITDAADYDPPAGYDYKWSAD